MSDAKYAGMDFDSIPGQLVAANSAPTAPSGNAKYAGMDFDSIPDMEDIVGSPGQQALTALETTASGLTLGLTDVAEAQIPKLLPESIQKYLPTPESIRERREINPAAAALGNFAGTTALLGLTGGLGLAGEAAKGAQIAAEGAQAAAKAGLLSRIAPEVAKLGAQGAILGTGNVISEAGLQDPSLTWQKAAAEIGIAGVLNGVIGGGILLSAEGLPIAAEKASAVSKAVKNLFGKAAGHVEDLEKPSAGGVTGELGEMIKRQKELADFGGVEFGTPNRAALEDVLSRYKLEPKMNEFQKASLESKQAQDAYQTLKEQSSYGPAFQNDEYLQKQNAIHQTNNDIKILAPTKEIVDDAIKGGEVASDYLTGAVEQEKKAAGELIGLAKELKTTGINHANNVMEVFSKAIPELSEIAEATGEGIKIKPYNDAMKISETTYNEVKKTINRLNSAPEDFGALFKIRQKMGEDLNPLTAPLGPLSEVNKLKKQMLTYMENVVENHGENLPSLRDSMKRYAIASERNEALRKAFTIDTGDRFLSIYQSLKQDPAKITDKIFKNQNTVLLAKSMLPKEEFDHIVANYLSQKMSSLRQGTTKVGEFSGPKWNTWLTKNRLQLEAAFSERPQVLRHIQDGSEIMRHLPDAPSPNPSGTSKTHNIAEKMKEHFKDTKSIPDAGFKALSFIKDAAYGKVQKQIEAERINQQLLKQKASYSLGDHLGKLVKQTSDKIDKHAKAIFNEKTLNKIGPTKTEAVKKLGSGVVPSASRALSKKEEKKHGRE